MHSTSSINNQKQSTHDELTPVIITKYKQIRSDEKADTNTSPEMKISCNVKQGTSLVKNSSQTVEIKNKTNEKKAISLDIFCCRYGFFSFVLFLNSTVCELFFT